MRGPPVEVAARLAPRWCCLLLLLLVLVLVLPLRSHAAAGAGAGQVLAERDDVGFGELQEEWRGQVVRLSWSPRAFLVKGLLTAEECRHLLDAARAIDPVRFKQGGSKPPAGKARAGSGIAIPREHDEVVAGIAKRLAQVSMVPTDHQEQLEVLRLAAGGGAGGAHVDYLDASDAGDAEALQEEHGGQRKLTLLMQLTAPPASGNEVVFPDAEAALKVDSALWPDDDGPAAAARGAAAAHHQWSACAASKGLAVALQQGDGLLFHHLHPDGSLDASSRHANCPPAKGDAWALALRARVNPADRPHNWKQLRYGSCQDDEAMCREWAHRGECESNPGYMLATCARACKACGASAPRCVDSHHSCSYWAKIGECEKNADYMRDSCKFSCGVCDQPAKVEATAGVQAQT